MTIEEMTEKAFYPVFIVTGILWIIITKGLFKRDYDDVLEKIEKLLSKYLLEMASEKKLEN